MNSLLERPALRQRVVPISVEAYHHYGKVGWVREDVELLRGIIFKKMPKSPLHEIVLRLLARLLNRVLTNRHDVRIEAPLTLRDSEPEPDIAVVPWEPEKQGLEHPATALLVVEVSISTLDVDQEKAGIYAEAGVSEYWIVRPEQREIDVYREPVAGVFRAMSTLREGDTLRALALQEVAFPIGEIFPPKA